MVKKILVIEDDFRHKEDAREFFQTRRDVEVTYASNYADAAKVMFKKDKETYEITKGNIDGVISDIYFPLVSDGRWDQPEPIGVRVAVELSQLEIPFVLNTAGYHHGRKYQWIHELATKQGWKIIDTGSDHEKDTDSKNWKGAYQSLEEKMK
jgi:hypothetical protein